jgi:hypothetical protein
MRCYTSGACWLRSKRCVAGLMWQTPFLSASRVEMPLILPLWSCCLVHHALRIVCLGSRPAASATISTHGPDRGPHSRQLSERRQHRTVLYEVLQPQLRRVPIRCGGCPGPTRRWLVEGWALWGPVPTRVLQHLHPCRPCAGIHLQWNLQCGRRVQGRRG